MFENKLLIECEKRKSELLLESELNRSILKLETTALQPAVTRIEAGLTLAHKAVNIWNMAAPLLTLWQMRKSSKESSGFFGKAARGWAFAQSILSLWKGCQAKDSNPEHS